MDLSRQVMGLLYLYYLPIADLVNKTARNALHTRQELLDMLVTYDISTVSLVLIAFMIIHPSS
jgi:hypothetical protein